MHWSLSLTLRYIIFKFFLWFISLYSFQDSNQTDSNYFFYIFYPLYIFCIFIYLCCILNIFFCFIFLVKNSVFCFYSIYCHIHFWKFYFNYYFLHSRCYLVLFKVYGFFMLFFFSNFQWKILSL